MIEILAALSVWRITYMLQEENGPFNVFKRLPEWWYDSDVSDCFYCLSIWTSIPFAIALGYNNIVYIPLYIFGLSAASIFINLLHERIE